MPVAAATMPEICMCRLCLEAALEAGEAIFPRGASRTISDVYAAVARVAARQVGTNPSQIPRQGLPGRSGRARAPRYTWINMLEWIEERTEIEYCRTCGNPEGGRCGCTVCDCGCRVREETQRCSHCDCCNDHCECSRCECGARFNPDRDDPDDWCSDCDRCSGCCSCSSDRRTSHGTMHGKPSPRYPRHVGVEIELGYSRGRRGTKALIEWAKKWDAALQDDGSINFDTSMEIATAPARGGALVEQISELGPVFKLIKAEVDVSCGLHVHVSAKDMTKAQILALVRLYAKTEAALFSIVAPSRRTGTYSKMWASTFESADVFEKGSVTARFDRLEAAVYGSKHAADSAKRNRGKHACRYHGLNLNALILYGTIEFRLHHGTVNTDKILMWAGVCSALMEYAATHSEKEIAKLSGSSWEVLTKVLRGDPQILAWAKSRRAYFAKRTGHDLGLNDEPKAPSDYEAGE